LGVQVTYSGFDCYVPDPLHVLDPLRFYTQQLLRLSPFFTNGSSAALTTAQQARARPRPALCDGLGVGGAASRPRACN
jgi:hypothetical protein